MVYISQVLVCLFLGAVSDFKVYPEDQNALKTFVKFIRTGIKFCLGGYTGKTNALDHL
jgi:hypothetical protein